MTVWVELSNTYGNDVASAFLNDSGYVKTEKMLNKIKVAAEEYIAAEINLAETDYLLKATPNNAIKKQICSQKRISVPYYLRKSALYQANKFFLSAR